MVVVVRMKGDCFLIESHDRAFDDPSIGPKTHSVAEMELRQRLVGFFLSQVFYTGDDLTIELNKLVDGELG